MEWTLFSMELEWPTVSEHRQHNIFGVNTPKLLFSKWWPHCGTGSLNILIPHGTNLFTFYPRDAMLARVFATATCLSLSVCLSVRPSVTRRYCA